jgi:hypothetical protein
MNKLLAVIFAFLLLSACKKSEKDTEEKLEDALINGLIDCNIQLKSKSLLLFISEGMCSECINKEFMNLRNDSIFGDNVDVIVIGIFSKKRHFLSTVNHLPRAKKIFIDKNTINKDVFAKGVVVFYSVYDKQSKQLTNIFYPDPCDQLSTLQYYKTIK